MGSHLQDIVVIYIYIYKSRLWVAIFKILLYIYIYIYESRLWRESSNYMALFREFV